MWKFVDISSRGGSRTSLEDTRGFVLPTVLMLMMVLSTISVFLLISSGDQQRAGRAMRESARSFYAADAGLQSAIANWDQGAFDTLLANAGDSLVMSPTTIENGCSYQLVYTRIDGGDSISDKLYSVASTGRTPGLDGATQRVGAIIVGEGGGESMAMIFGGDLIISANPHVLGPCGHVHVNGALDITASPTLAGRVSASDTVLVTGAPLDTLGNPITTAEYEPTMEIPDLIASDYCGEAEIIFDNTGHGLRVSTSETHDFNGGVAKWGWKYDDDKNMYYTDSQAVVEGVYCTNGNMEISTDLGQPGDPADVTFLATGSVVVNSNSFLTSAHSENLLFLAEGDLNLSGNFDAGTANFGGMIYGGAQCQFAGNLRHNGQIWCRDNPNPAGSEPLVDENIISGSMELTHECGGWLLDGQAGPAPLTERGWSHVW